MINYYGDLRFNFSVSSREFNKLVRAIDPSITWELRTFDLPDDTYMLEQACGKDIDKEDFTLEDWEKCQEVYKDYEYTYPVFIFINEEGKVIDNPLGLDIYSMLEKMVYYSQVRW